MKVPSSLLEVLKEPKLDRFDTGQRKRRTQQPRQRNEATDEATDGFALLLAASHTIHKPRVAGQKGKKEKKENMFRDLDGVCPLECVVK